MKQRNPVLRVLLSLLITAVLGALYFYITIPAINGHSESFYIFIIVLCVIYLVVSRLLGGGKGKKNGDSAPKQTILEPDGKGGLRVNRASLRRQKNKQLSAEQKARLRSGLKELESSSDPVHQRRDDNYVLPRPLVVGDEVLLYDIDKEATVLELPKDGTVLVQAGIIKTRVPLENVRLLSKRQLKKKNPTRTVTKNVSTPETSSSLDLRGQTVEEALMEVDNFLDRASRMHLSQVTIIHGKGTGALRTAVQQHLRRCSQVKSFRLGTYGEGESGVTIAELK